MSFLIVLSPTLCKGNDKYIHNPHTSTKKHRKKKKHRKNIKKRKKDASTNRALCIDSVQGSSPPYFFSPPVIATKSFIYSRHYFSHFFPKISNLYLAKPWKYGLFQFWRFHLGCSIITIIIIFFFFFFIIRLNFYEVYLQNGAT